MRHAGVRADTRRAAERENTRPASGPLIAELAERSGECCPPRDMPLGSTVDIETQIRTNLQGME